MAECAERDQPLRVLHMIAGLGGAGAERQLALLVRSADRSRVRHGVCFFQKGIYFEELRAATPDLWYSPRPHRFSLALPLGLRRPLREFRPHLVQTWLSYMDIVGVAVTRLTTRIPVLASERNTRLQYQDTGSPLVVVLRNFTRRHLATAIVANSEGGRDYLERDVRVRAPVVVVKNGLDLAALDAAPPASVDALRRDGGPLLLYVGRLAPTKNPANLLRAMPEIANARPEVRLLLCGAGPEEGELKRLAGALGVEASVEWMGYRADVWSLMKVCDLLVHPAFTEGDPNVLVEAAAARIPLCVSDIPAHREFTGGASCAVFFDPHSPRSIARTVLGALLEDPAREQRVAEARAVAEGRSAHRMAQSYEALYRRFTASRR